MANPSLLDAPQPQAKPVLGNRVAGQIAGKGKLAVLFNFSTHTNLATGHAHTILVLHAL